MYRKTYRQGVEAKGVVKKPPPLPPRKRKTPKKVIKYGPPRKKETSWAKDFRLLVLVTTAFMDDSDDDDVDKMPTIEEEEEMSRELHVEEVNLHIEENSTSHHTDSYHCVSEEEDESKREPVLRRGKEFKLTITFDREYNKEKNDLLFKFTLGKNPSVSKNTQIDLELTENSAPATDNEDWYARIIQKEGKDLCVGVTSPHDCIIGEWRLTIVTSSIAEEVCQLQYKVPEDFNLIFNPWCKEDPVYLLNEKLTAEYVLNDAGAIYTGTSNRIGSKAWNFGQFDEQILQICFHLLRRPKKGHVHPSQADPIQVVRQISNTINDAVLIGNWSGNYDGGKKPTAWSGSCKILKKFFDEGKPVCYGQCWVFSGVFTTVCRALGIPCRSVTNFNSAHDTDKSGTIDTVYIGPDESGELDVEPGADSVWNFHVWNECWLARKDLPPGCDGWQVIDATPQEKSEGVFCCGPASVAAIKRGECKGQYDTLFVFSEVNADSISWLKESETRYSILFNDENRVGNFISTVDPFSPNGEIQRLDITNQYKFPEGSEEERNAVANATGSAKGNRLKPPVQISIESGDEKNRYVGQPIEVTVGIKNDGIDMRTVSKLIVSFRTKTYNGVVCGPLKKKFNFENIEIPPRETHTLKVELQPDDYIYELFEQALIEARCTATIKETNNRLLKTEDIRQRRWDLTLKVPEKPRKGEPFELTICMHNYMPINLTKASFDIEGIYYDDDIPVPGEIPANSDWEFKREVTIKRKGKHQISANFDCAEIQDITGRIRFELVG